jgi:hypothetical protein
LSLKIGKNRRIIVTITSVPGRTACRSLFCSTSFCFVAVFVGKKISRADDDAVLTKLVRRLKPNFFILLAKDERFQLLLHSCTPGADPTISSYNASVVNIYNATSSLVRLQNKNIFLFFLKKRSILLPTTLAL